MLLILASAPTHHRVQVYDISADKPIATAKAYGKSIKPADLPNGIAQFFPLAASSVLQRPAAEPTTGIETLRATGLSQDLLLPILRGILADVEEIYDVVKDIELRMVGSSLLIVYEADWDRAREGLRLLREAEQRAEAEQSREEHAKQQQEEEEEEDSSDSDDENVVGPPFDVRLIDFAHTKLVPGRGPDEGVLLGLRTVIDLLKGRITQIEIGSESTPSST